MKRNRKEISSFKAASQLSPRVRIRVWKFRSLSREIVFRALRTSLAPPVFDRPRGHQALHERPGGLEPLARLGREALAQFEGLAAHRERERGRRRAAKRTDVDVEHG